jgi:hypothetical protein
MSVGFRHTSHAHSYGTSGGVGVNSSGYENPSDARDAQEEMLECVNIDCKHDVPFVAGMSKDGETLYVDKEAYPEIEKAGYLRALIVHEMVEHCLMSDCGMKYQEAHAIATGAEESCLRADKIDQTKYNTFYDKIIRKVAARGAYKNVPDDLDTEPYVDSGDEKDIEENEPAGGKASYGS